MHAWFVLAFKFDMVAQIKFQRTHVWPTKCCYLNIGLVDSLRLNSSVPLWRAGEANVAPHVGGGGGRGRVQAGPRGQGATGRRVGRGTGEVSLRAGLMNSPARGRLALQLGWSCTAVVVDPTSFNSIVAIWSQTNG